MKIYLERTPERYRASDAMNAVFEFTKGKLFNEALDFVMLPALNDENRAKYLGFIGHEQNKNAVDSSTALKLLQEMKDKTDKQSRLYASICFSIGVVISNLSQKRLEFDDAKTAIEAQGEQRTILGDSIKNLLAIEMAKEQCKAELLDDARETLVNLPNERINPLYISAVKTLALSYAKKQRFKDALEVAHELLGADRLLLIVEVLDIQSKSLHPSGKRDEHRIFS